MADPITYPMKLHVDAFRSFGADFVSCNSNCACIVTVDGCAFLWVAKVMENSAQHCTFPAIDKEGGIFSFSHGSNNDRYEGTNSVAGAVICERVVMIEKVVDTTGNGSGVRPRQIRSI